VARLEDLHGEDSAPLLDSDEHLDEDLMEMVDRLEDRIEELDRLSRDLQDLMETPE
jgi:hypothetical protein